MARAHGAQERPPLSQGKGRKLIVLQFHSRPSPCETGGGQVGGNFRTG